MKNMTKIQLQDICKQKGISFKSKDTKETLIDLINNNKPKPQEGEGFNGEY